MPESPPPALALATRAIHAGREPDPTTGALLTPIHQVTTYAQEGLGKNKGYTYSRTGNPTVAALEARLAGLETGCAGLAFGSGIAAVDAVFRLLSAGDHAIVSETAYGGTIRLARQVLARHGVSFTFVDTADPEEIAGAVTPETRLLLTETPANPTLKITDLVEASRVAREHGIVHAVDNTFLTPYLQRPLELGADIVVHSTTKFLEGHGSTVGGAVVVRDDPDLVERLRFLRNATGAVLGPFEAWLTLRGIETLPVRLDRHCDTALAVARFLERRPGVSRVLHPEISSFPQRALAQRQQRRGGGVVTVELTGGLPAVERFVSALQIFTLAEHVGSVESLATHPATMTHASLTAGERASRGITDGLVRLSVGLEDRDDLLRDLGQALARANSVEVPA